MSMPHEQEIGAFAWHYVSELPATVEEANQVRRRGHPHGQLPMCQQSLTSAWAGYTM
jgi:hypothetical protein